MIWWYRLFLNEIWRNLLKISMIISITIKHSPIFPSVPGYTKLIYLQVWSSWSVKWTPVTESVTLSPQMHIYKWTQVLQKSLPLLNLACKSMHKTSSWQSFSGLDRKESPIWMLPGRSQLTHLLPWWCGKKCIVKKCELFTCGKHSALPIYPGNFFNWKILNILKPNIQRITF